MRYIVCIFVNSWQTWVYDVEKVQEVPFWSWDIMSEINSDITCEYDTLFMQKASTCNALRKTNRK